MTEGVTGKKKHVSRGHDRRGTTTRRLPEREKKKKEPAKPFEWKRKGEQGNRPGSWPLGEVSVPGRKGEERNKGREKREKTFSSPRSSCVGRGEKEKSSPLLEGG